MGNWKVIVPVGSTNYITNPSFETGTTGWSASGTNTIAQSAAASKFGAHSLKCTYADNTVMAYYGITVPATSYDYGYSVWVYIPSDWDGGSITLDTALFTGATLSTGSESTTTTGKWVRLEAILTIAADDTGRLRISTSQAPTAGKFIYIDAAQLDGTNYVTTYIDGAQPECYWDGAAHASISYRDHDVRGGGRVRDFDDDLGLEIMNFGGSGAAVPIHALQDAALQDGQSYQGTTLAPRDLILMGEINPTGVTDFHSVRHTLTQALSARINRLDQRPLPVRLRYTGAAVDKEIDALYVGGLEMSVSARACLEGIPLRFLAPDPVWRQIGETAAELSTTFSTSTVRLVAGRVLGAWTNLGPPDAAGTYTDVFEVAVGKDRTIYFGGDFLNFDNRANCDYIAQWSGSAWASLGTGMDGVVHALAIGPDGNLYAGGAFTTAGGVTCRGIAMWDGSNWNALGPPSSGGTVNSGCIVWDSAGNLYVGGDFTNWDGIANADYIAKWNGSAWAAVGTPADDIVRALAVDSNDNLYAVGSFLNIGGGGANRAAMWNGSAWVALGTGLNGIGRAAIIARDGTLYVGGDFTTAGGNTCTRMASWNGAGWLPLGDGCNNSVYTIVEGPDGNLYVGGVFTSAGGSSLADSLAIWNGSVWVHPDIDLPSTDTVYGIAFDRDDLYIGFGNIGAATFSGNTSISYTGNERAYPYLTIKRSGGTTATLEYLENLTTGAKVYFSYTIRDGEELLIDFRPGRRGMTSSFAGQRNRDILPGSDMGNFYLKPTASGTASNKIICYIHETGSPTMDVFLIWQDAYNGVD